jgi:DNA-binding transcriptional MerR regulator
MILKTTAVADLLGVRYANLFYLVRERLIPIPQKDSSGDLVWSEDDVEAARQVLARMARRRARSTAVA